MFKSNKSIKKGDIFSSENFVEYYNVVRWFFDELKFYKKIIVMGHKSPDGDCVASTCALASLIKRVLKRDKCNLEEYDIIKVNADEIPSRFSVIPTSSDIKKANEVIKNCNGKDELLLIVDCASFNGLGISEEDFSKFESVALIDHHSLGDLHGKGWINFVDKEYTSTAHMIYSMNCMLSALSSVPPRELGIMYYVGMNTDTLGFSVGKIDNAFFRDLGYITTDFNTDDVQNINDVLLRNDSMEMFQYKGHVINNVKFRKQSNGVGVASYVNNDKEKLNNEFTRFTVSIYNNIEGYEICYFVKAVGNNCSRISIRSRNKRINVAKIMKELFGGGGHPAAAGAYVEKTSEEVDVILQNYNFIENEEEA